MTLSDVNKQYDKLQKQFRKAVAKKDQQKIKLILKQMQELDSQPEVRAAIKELMRSSVTVTS